jgi:N6-L-threonylcarbamoyladenine synthase
MKDFGKYRIVGQTRDDAAGEAFDKTAKLMGLPYPGGPQIAKLALEGDVTAFDLPRPMMKDPSLDFSFSGLKTAVRIAWEPWIKGPVERQEQAKRDLAASLQQAIVDVLIEKTLRAAKKYKVKGVLLVGGVSANQLLRESLDKGLAEHLPGVAFLPSDRKYITDNAAMIAAAGAWNLWRRKGDDWRKMDANPEWNV